MALSIVIEGRSTLLPPPSFVNVKKEHVCSRPLFTMVGTAKGKRSILNELAEEADEQLPLLQLDNHVRTTSTNTQK